MLYVVIYVECDKWGWEIVVEFGELYIVVLLSVGFESCVDVGWMYVICVGVGGIGDVCVDIVCCCVDGELFIMCCVVVVNVEDDVVSWIWDVCDG